MIEATDIVQVTLNEDEVALCRSYARDAEIGGRSNIRGREDRDANLSLDNVVGQYGTLAFACWLLPDCGVDAYVVTREAQNENPTQGDGGIDLLGIELDVKTSVCRGNQPLREYNLLVRPNEYHRNWLYLLGLIPHRTPEWTWKTVTVLLMGWCKTKDLPQPGLDTRFGDARALVAEKLRPLPELGEVI